MNGESTGQDVPLRPRRISTMEIGDALITGWRTFKHLPRVSIGFSMIFVLTGLLLLTALGWFGLSPLALPFAGGFMLTGPILLTGFFELALRANRGEPVSFATALRGLGSAPLGVWVVAGVCAFLFLIWITDAAILYSFMVGPGHLPYELPWLIGIRKNVIGFEILSSVMGSALAFIIFAISSFSIPLLYEGRTSLVHAVSLSVRAVFSNIAGSLSWGILLSVCIIVSALLLPLLLISLPVLSYASFALYQAVFPAEYSIRPMPES